MTTATTNTATEASVANEGRPLVGILLVTAAVFTFALSDVVTKHLTEIYPVAVVIAVRYLVNVVLLFGFCGRNNARACGRHSGPDWCCCAACAWRWPP